MKLKLFLLVMISFFAAQNCKRASIQNGNDTESQVQLQTPLQVQLQAQLTTQSSSEIYNVCSITCANGGKAMEVRSAVYQEERLATGAKIQLWQTPSATTAQKWQKWYVEQTGSYFKLFNLFSGKYLDNTGGTSNQGVQQDQWDVSPSDAQLWSITPVGTNMYKIVNKASGLALTNENANSNNGNAVTQRTYTAATSQQWHFNPFALESYRDDLVTRYFMRTSGTVAWDGNQSVPLTYGPYNGKQMWLTNDEFYNQLNANGKINCYGSNLEFFHKNNAAMIQPADNWDPAATTNIILNNGTYQEEIFHDLTGHVLWPGAGVEIGSKVYVTNIEVQGLTAINAYLGVIDLVNNTSYITTVNGFSNQTNIQYSVGMVKDGTTVYVYGIDGGLNPNLYVAKFSTDAPTSWTFWDGFTWAANPSKTTAARLVTGLPSGGVNVAKVGAKYVVVSHDFAFNCGAVYKNFYSATSNGPNLPFGNKKTIYQVPDTYQNVTPVFYTPIIHPQFVNGHNELLITYCTNFWDNKSGGGSCVNKCTSTGADPNGYRPKAFRVPYSVIGL
jgi:hypothetical protein